MNASRKFFTAEEANRRLPLVRAIVEDIVRLYRDVHDRRERLERVRQLPGARNRNENSVYGEELRQAEEELERDVARLQEFASELRDLGAELKDPVIGLVDFPMLMDGREACLCWKLGEAEIAWWHEKDAGFQGRQSLLEGSLSGGDAADEQTG